MAARWSMRACGAAIWAGSIFGGGLYRVNGDKVQHLGQAEGLKSNYVYTVFADEKGDLWIGSTDGLSWFQNGTLHTANSQQGLTSDQVFAIVDDSYDRLWFATFAGIASLEKKSLTDWAEGRRDRLNPTVYRATDEMAINTVATHFPMRSGRVMGCGSLLRMALQRSCRQIHADRESTISRC